MTETNVEEKCNIQCIKLNCMLDSSTNIWASALLLHSLQLIIIRNDQTGTPNVQYMIV